MMTDRLFNSIFENSLRMVLLLDLYDMPQSLDTLYAVDFISVYGESFGITESNLNGDNPYMFSEFASRREIVREALKMLVIYGIVLPLNLDSGVTYIITSDGEEYAEILTSYYAKEYKRSAAQAILKYGNLTDVQLIKMINKNSVGSFRKGDKHE